MSISGATNYCQLTILSVTEANINIHTAEETISFTLPPGQVYKKDYGEDLHPTQGMENKAIRVSSDVELQVLIYKTESSRHQNDIFMVPNHIRENNTFFTSAYTGLIDCSSAYVKQFYLVTSFYNNTSVHIQQQDGTTYDLDLPTFGTFVQSTMDENDHLAMGTKITSNKLINIVSGKLCVRNNAGSLSWIGTYASSMPSTDGLNQQYIAPNIIHEDMNAIGYSITVVATEDGTTVESDGEAETLDEGQTAIFEYPLIDKSIFINCSKNCLVTQYSKHAYESSSAWSGPFMQTLLSENDFSTSHFFTTHDSYPISYLSLVVKGEAPGDDLYLNGTSLGYLSWNPIHGYSSAELAIPQGVYELYSAGGRSFGAYVYIYNMDSANAGAGYTLLPMESFRVSPSTPSTESTTIPPTSSPSVNGTFPYHTARVNGTARTEDGEDMTPTCIMVGMKYLQCVTYFLPR